MKSRNVYSAEYKEWLKINASIYSIEDIIKISKEKFGFEISLNGMGNLLYRNKLKHKNYNKNKATNGAKKPIGYEYKKPDGIVLVKVAEPDVWQNKQRYIYEKYYNVKKPIIQDELFDVLNDYLSVSNRRITFEYIMLEGINDSRACALELSKLIQGMNAYVNLIPYNETENIGFKRTKKEKILEFYDILKKNNINVTIRREFGGKVDAACGQLRANQMGGL